MVLVFDKLMSRFKSLPSYEEQKKTAESGKPDERLSLAQHSETHKEILFYLAENDPDEKVREAVARNEKTPIQASGMLAVDSSEDVRFQLAKRLITLLPDVAVDAQSQLYAYTVQALGTLALDEVLKIRKALTSALKDHAFAPPAVAVQLAKDLEMEVSEPILRFCTMLNDTDLIDVLSDHPAAWVAEAVAGRRKISAPVSKAVIKTGHAKAGQILLENKGAEIDQEVLQTIIDRAREFPEWHEPLARNHTLPPEMAKQLARYVDTRIRNLLLKKGDYDLQTTEIVVDASKRRMAMAEALHEDEGSVAHDKAKRLYNAGGLTEEIIADALALRHKDFVLSALAFMNGMTPQDIQKAFAIKKPRIVCAICWKAGLSMRLAFRVQQDMAHIPPKELLYPKNGSDYPINKKDMNWQLEFLGFKK